MKAIKGGKNRITILKEDYVDLNGLDREDFIKPALDYEMFQVFFNLKPWKWRASWIISIWDNRQPIKEFIEETILRLQKEGKFKRRIVESVTVEYRINKKL